MPRLGKLTESADGIFVRASSDGKFAQHHRNGNDEYTKEIYEEKDKLEKVRARFFSAFETLRETDNVKIIDASGTPDEVASSILKFFN